MLSARVSAAVKSAHMAALNARLSRKKVPRTRNSTILFVAESERKSAMCEERVDVSAVVVLGVGEQENPCQSLLVHIAPDPTRWLETPVRD